MNDIQFYVSSIIDKLLHHLTSVFRVSLTNFCLFKFRANNFHHIPVTGSRLSVNFVILLHKLSKGRRRFGFRFRSVRPRPRPAPSPGSGPAPSASVDHKLESSVAVATDLVRIKT